MIVWIHKLNQLDYTNLMQSEGSAPIIYQENESDVQVGMTASAMQTWVAVGFWYSF